MEKDFTDLQSLMEYLKVCISESCPNPVWVKAEIGQVNHAGTGHCYLDLVQSDALGNVVAKAKAAMWRSRANLLLPKFEAVTGTALKAGMQVLVHLQVTFSEVYGMTLTIDNIDPEFTVGQQEIQRKKTIQKLIDLGLMEKQKGLQLCRLPYRLAVISSETAAGYGDFVNHIRDNPYGFVLKTDLYPASVQGTSAPESIAGAISQALSSGIPYDAVLLLRGGGSAQDLICFDDFLIAEAIANCPVPVITAIGHDRDFHIADMVAYEYVKTPTALADFFINIYKAEDDHLLALEKKIGSALSSRLSQMQARLDSAVARLCNVALLKVERASSAVSLLEARITSADPRQILKRGYTLATDSKGVVLKNATTVSVGDRVGIRFADSTLDCEVKDKTINR